MVVVGHIWNVCKVSGIRAMPSHVNNQKLQPRFQRVSGHTAHVCRIYVYTADRSGPSYCRLYTNAIRVRNSRVCTNSRAHTGVPDRRAAPRRAAHLSRRIALADTSARVLLLDHASF